MAKKDTTKQNKAKNIKSDLDSLFNKKAKKQIEKPKPEVVKPVESKDKKKVEQNKEKLMGKLFDAAKAADKS